MAAQPRHLYSLLALLDPLLRLAALVVEADNLPIRKLRVGHDEAQPRKHFSGMMLNLGNHAPRHRSTGRPIEKALVPDHGLMSRTAYWPNEQLCNVPQQTVVGRNPNRVLRSTLFQCLIDVRLCKSGINPEPDHLAQFLQPLNLRQQELFPAVGAVNVAWPQLCGHAVAPAIEQEKRVIAGGRIVRVVGTVLLLPVSLA